MFGKSITSEQGTVYLLPQHLVRTADARLTFCILPALENIDCGLAVYHSSNTVRVYYIPRYIYRYTWYRTLPEPLQKQNTASCI